MMSNEQNRRDFFKLCTTVGAGFSLCCMDFMRCKKSDTEKPTNTANVPPETVDEDFKELGYCSLQCIEKCKIYHATKNNDIEKKKEISKNWSSKFNKDFKPEDVHCDGCKSDHTSYFAANLCNIRKCAIEKHVITCAHCKEFPVCEKEEWIKWPNLRNQTEEIRSKL